VVTDFADKAIDLVDVQPRLRPDLVAVLPIRALLRARPRHRLTDDVTASEVHKAKWSQRVFEHIDIAAPTRTWIESMNDEGHGSPHDAGRENTVAGAAEPHGSGHEFFKVELTVLSDRDPKPGSPLLLVGFAKV